MEHQSELWDYASKSAHFRFDLIKDARLPYINGLGEVDTQPGLNHQYIDEKKLADNQNPYAGSRRPEVDNVIDDIEALNLKYSPQKAPKIVTDGYYGTANLSLPSDVQLPASDQLLNGSAAQRAYQPRQAPIRPNQLLQSTRMLDHRNITLDTETPNPLKVKNDQKLANLRDYHQNQLESGAVSREFGYLDGGSSLN